MNKHECKNCKNFIESSFRGLPYGYCLIRGVSAEGDWQIQVLKDYSCSCFEKVGSQEVRSEYLRGYEKGYSDGYLQGTRDQESDNGGKE